MTTLVAPYTGCDVCRDRAPGWIYGTNAAGQDCVSRCACWWTRFAYPASVPYEFRTARFDTWTVSAETAHALRHARQFLDADAPRDLYLVGPVGTGKTRLACSLLNEWFQRHRTGLFLRVPYLLLKLQPSQGNHEADLFQAAERAPVLVLDDLGAEREKASDYTRRTLLTLYEARHDAGYRTVWTSNRTPADVGDAMGDDRLMSRLVGRCDVVALTGRDQRLRRAR